MTIEKKARIFNGFVGIVVFAFVLYGFMKIIEGSLGSNLLPYTDIEQQAGDNIWHTILWFFGDMTEAQFYKSFLAGIGLILFALFAHILDKRRSKLAGFSISYGSGLWPWVLVASSLGLAISILCYGHLLGEEWLPTFVPFVSIPGALVLIYGGGWKNTLTGAILGGLLGFPIAWFVIETILQPIDMPNVIGNVTGMWLGAIIVFEVCKYLPWMTLEDDDEPLPEDVAVPVEEENEKSDSNEYGNSWFVRRVLADFTEAQFYGNEWASIGLILGVLVMWLLNPIHPVYGSGLLPAVLLGQFLSLALSNFLYSEQWEIHGWYPTFVPVVSVAPAVALAFDGALSFTILGAIFGAIIGPPIAQMIIRHSPKHWHPVVGNTFSMALSTLLVVFMLQNLPL